MKEVLRSHRPVVLWCELVIVTRVVPLGWSSLIVLLRVQSLNIVAKGVVFLRAVCCQVLMKGKICTSDNPGVMSLWQFLAASL